MSLLNLPTARSVVIPALCIAGVNAWRLWEEHWEHVSHMPPIEERPEYPFMNIRTKNFFWGDGDKVRGSRCRDNLDSLQHGDGTDCINRPSSGTRRSTTTRRSKGRSVLWSTQPEYCLSKRRTSDWSDHLRGSLQTDRIAKHDFVAVETCTYLTISLREA